jgi:orotate phosphoribosyltransferase
LGGAILENELRDFITSQGLLLHRRPFMTNSGVLHEYFLKAKELMLDPNGSSLIAKEVHKLVALSTVSFVGGLSEESIPMASNVVLFSYLNPPHLQGFYIRTEQKTYGVERLVEGKLVKNSEARVAMVADTITTGASLLVAIEAVEAYGCSIALVICILDLEKGGGDTLRKKGYEFHSLLKLSDFTH